MAAHIVDEILRLTEDEGLDRRQNDFPDELSESWATLASAICDKFDPAGADDEIYPVACGLTAMGMLCVPIEQSGYGWLADDETIEELLVDSDLKFSTAREMPWMAPAGVVRPSPPPWIADCVVDESGGVIWGYGRSTSLRGDVEWANALFSDKSGAVHRKRLELDGCGRTDVLAGSWLTRMGSCIASVEFGIELAVTEPDSRDDSLLEPMDPWLYHAMEIAASLASSADALVITVTSMLCSADERFDGLDLRSWREGEWSDLRATLTRAAALVDEFVSAETVDESDWLEWSLAERIVGEYPS